MAEAVVAEVAADVFFATAAEAIAADTAFMAISAVEAAGLTVGGGLAAAEISAGSMAAETLLAGDALYGTAAADGTALLAGDATLGVEAAANAVDPAAAEAASKAAQSSTKTLADKILKQTSKGGGVMDSIGKWAKSTPGGMVLGQMGAGALQGMGAAGSAKGAAKTKAEADKALLSQQTEERLRMSREGVYKGGAVKPSGQKVLYRADGTPVYVSGGLVNNAIG